jgi:hypothetical protein
MAGSVVYTPSNPNRGPSRPVEKVVLAWTSSAGGAVSGNPFGPVSGEILRVVFIPGTAGVQPSNGYSATLIIKNGDGNDDGLDLLSGQGASLANNANADVCPSVAMKDGVTTSTTRRAVDDLVDLVVSGAGNAKSGTVVLYVR